MEGTIKIVKGSIASLCKYMINILHAPLELYERLNNNVTLTPKLRDKNQSTVKRSFPVTYVCILQSI
jgi:hypothetical protein